MSDYTLVEIAFLAVIGLFVIGRAVVLWYWRVNEQVALLKDIRDSLELLVAALEPE